MRIDGDSWLVTLKFKKNVEHDPRNKKTGECFVSKFCTDVTGSHHSAVVYGRDEKHVRELVHSVVKDVPLFEHITRIEKILVRIAMYHVKCDEN
jgi:hypothetical protein